MSYTRKCAYCGRWFEAKRPHAVYCKDTCRTNAWERDGFDAEQDQLQRVEGQAAHPLQTTREEQEASKEKARWTLMIREHLSRTLLATGYVHADDFDALGVPDEHRNCIGSQMGPFVQKGWMVEVSRRASANPRRKKAKSAVYQLTAKGRTELSKQYQGPTARSDTLNSEGSAATEVESAHGAAPSTGRAGLHPGVPHGAESSRSVRPGGGHNGAGPALPQECGVESPTDTAAGSVSTPDASSPRSSSEEQRSSNPQAPGSNPGGGTQQRRAADVKSARGSEVNPLADYRPIGCGDDRLESSGTGQDAVPGGKTEVPAVAAEQGTLSSEGAPGVLQLDIPRESESSAYSTVVDEAA